MASIAPVTPIAGDHSDIEALVRGMVSNEIVFGVVGPVGSGTSEIAETLDSYLRDSGYGSRVFKARDVIMKWAERSDFKIAADSPMSQTELLQDAGDELRRSTTDHAAVALRVIADIRAHRASITGIALKKGEAVTPDEKKRAYIIDSLRNPAEVHLLRRVYQQNFCLIGVVCDEETRLARLQEKFADAGKAKIESFMARDEKASEKHGQQVSATFHLSDFFVDNSVPRILKTDVGESKANPDWTVVDELGRLTDIITHSRVIRPRPNETAMYHAYGARMRSACLSRQVGAALMDSRGNVLSTGTNEVPRAGGGVYGGFFEAFSDKDPKKGDDFRCAVHGGYCRNTVEQNDIIKELEASLSEMSIVVPPGFASLLRSTRLGQLIEFSRAVHAEMDALLSAGRQGVSTVGSRLFVTTYPCHNCARHIVSAGVDEVQFVEPYLKSRALPLHGDSITTKRSGWIPPSQFAEKSEKEIIGKAPQVLFRPFTGVAPRLYRRAFYKDRELKDPNSGKMLSSFPSRDGTGPIETMRLSYAQIEATLAEEIRELE